MSVTQKNNNAFWLRDRCNKMVHIHLRGVPPAYLPCFSSTMRERPFLEVEPFFPKAFSIRAK